MKIGVIYPLTGNAASAGQSAKDAVDLGAEIVNNPADGVWLFARVVSADDAGRVGEEEMIFAQDVVEITPIHPASGDTREAP